MTILITCIHGFVGNNLINSLKDHNSLVGLDIVSPVHVDITHTFNRQQLLQPTTLSI